MDYGHGSGHARGNSHGCGQDDDNGLVDRYTCYRGSILDTRYSQLSQTASLGSWTRQEKWGWGRHREGVGGVGWGEASGYNSVREIPVFSDALESGFRQYPRSG